MGRDLGRGRAAMTKVTVLLAVHDGAHFLKAALDSVLEQDLDHLELLVVEDASSDSTPEILRRRASADARIRVIRNERNLGLTASLVRGMEEARGTYIARLDADDVCAPGRLRAQAEYLDQHPACAVLGTSAVLIDEDGRPTERVREAPPEAALRPELLFRNPITHSSVMFRHEAIQALGGYDRSFPRAQDYDLWLRCVAAGLGLAMLPEALVLHRLHPDRVSVRRGDEQEACRRRAVREGFRRILGLDVDERVLGLVNELRLTGRVPDDASFRELTGLFRRMRKAWRQTFPGDGAGLEALEARLVRLTAPLADEEGVPRALADAWVRERPFPIVAMRYLRWKAARGAVRSRMRAGALRRRFMPDPGE